MRLQGNGPIGLKIGINVPQDPYYNSQSFYFGYSVFLPFYGTRDVFRWFQSISKILEKSADRCPIFGQKGSFLAIFKNPFWKKNFGRKFMRFQGNCPIGLKLGINVPQGPCQRRRKSFFGYLLFSPFYRTRYASKGLFLVNFGRFWVIFTKKTHIGSHKMAKTQNIQKISLRLQQGP